MKNTLKDLLKNGPISSLELTKYFNKNKIIIEPNKNLITEFDANKIKTDILLNDSGYTCIMDALNFPKEYFELKTISKFLDNQTIISNKLKAIKEILESINVEQGFISSTDIFDKQYYPII